MKKTFVIVLVCLALLLVGCTGAAKEEKAKIGVVVPDLNNAFCTAMDEGIKSAAAENGYEVFEYVTQMNPENDIASVEQLANNNVKAYYGLHMVTESVGDLLKNTYKDIGCFSQVKFDGAAQVLDDDFTVVAKQFTDAAIILRSIVGLSTITKRGALNAEVDGDGSITVADAAAILRYVVGLISIFPAQQP